MGLIIMSHFAQVMEALADHCPDMDIPYGSSHLTPLMLACMNGCIEMVECLVKHGAKLGASNSVGKTCLHLATANNQVKVSQSHGNKHWFDSVCAFIYFFRVCLLWLIQRPTSLCNNIDLLASLTNNYMCTSSMFSKWISMICSWT